MKKYLLLAALAGIGPCFAQTQALDPPMTREEQAIVEDLHRTEARNGMPPMSDAQVADFIRTYRSKRMEVLAGSMALRGAMPALEARVRSQAQSKLGGVAVSTGTPVGAAPALPQVPQATLLKQIKAHTEAAKPTTFERRRDGFSFNGQPMLDVQGTITAFGADNQTGNVTYAVQVAPGLALLKFRNVNSDLEPIVLGQISQQGDINTLQTVTGQSASGSAFIPTSRGAVLRREAGLVTYDIERALKATATPEGFLVTDFQNGDIAGTGFVLLEREQAPANAENPIASLISAGKNLKSAFNDTSVDYLLFNPQSGKTIPLNVSLRGKNILKMSGCKRQNALINKCAEAHTEESIWDTDGRPNSRHYFWAIRWMNTVHGPVAIVQENGSRKLSLINLANGNRHTLFETALGIPEWNIQQTASGSIRAEAVVKLRRQVIEDIGTVLQGAPDAPL